MSYSYGRSVHMRGILHYSTTSIVLGCCQPWHWLEAQARGTVVAWLAGWAQIGSLAVGSFGIGLRGRHSDGTHFGLASFYALKPAWHGRRQRMGSRDSGMVGGMGVGMGVAVFEYCSSC